MRITVFYDHVREACRQSGKELHEIAELLNKHGICGVEMDYGEVKRHTGKRFKELQRVGLPVQSVYAFFDWGNHPEDHSYKRMLKKLSRYGVRHVLAVPGFVKEGQDRAVCRERMAVVLQEMCRYAAKRKICVSIEDFDDCSAVFATGAEVRWFLDRIPELSCTFDTGNFLYSEERAEEMLPLLSDRIGYVHCKDRSLLKKEGELPKETIQGTPMYTASVGSGVIPMKELLDRIRESGYDGNYAIEHFGSKHQLDDMIASADWLNEVLREKEKV